MGVVKKCCFCCHNLATLIKERVGLEFVLQGTHSTILPWVPPRGIPLDVLVELRMTLLRALYNTVKEAVDTLLFTQTSPADSISPVAAYELYLSGLPDFDDPPPSPDDVSDEDEPAAPMPVADPGTHFVPSTEDL